MSATLRATCALAAALIAALGPIRAFAESPVAVEPVSSRTIVQQVNVSGTVTSPRTAVLSTAVAGLVADVLVDDGYRVEAGQPLLSLDRELAELAYERAMAEVRQGETAVADAERRLAEAEKVGTQRAIARTEIESRRAEVLSDRAALEATRAAAREQEALLARHTLRAPFAGVISDRQSEIGEWVNPGDGLFELVATENLRFDFRVAEDYFGSLSTDTPVAIRLDALPDAMLEGRIAAIVPVNNPGARTFLLRVVADNETGVQTITPGMSVRGTLRLDTGRTGITVTRDAILRFPDGRVTVWVVEQTGELPIVREQVVQTGLEFDGLVEITGGIAANDVVVTRGNETLQEGQTVTIVNTIANEAG